MTPPLLGACAVFLRMKTIGIQTAPVLALGQHSGPNHPAEIFQVVVGPVFQEVVG